MNLLKQIEHNELVENTLYEIINVINEERSIPYEIINAINDIKYKLTDSIKNNQSLPYNENFITFKKGEFNTVIFKNYINIIWEYYSFINEKLKNKTFIKNKSGQLRKTSEGYEINITIKAVNGKIDFVRTLETLQHEFEHLWERLHMKSPYKGMNAYKVAEQLMNDSYNDFNQSIGRILYLSKNGNKERMLMECTNI